MRNGSIGVVQSKLTGWDFGCDVCCVSYKAAACLEWCYRFSVREGVQRLDIKDFLPQEFATKQQL